MNFYEWYKESRSRFHSGHMNIDEIAYTAWTCSAEPLLSAIEDIINAVDEDPSLQEQMVIAQFGGDTTNLSFARAIRDAAKLVVGRRTE